MHCDYIFYCMLNDMIKNLKKYQKSLKYFSYNALPSYKKLLKKGYYGNKGLGLDWDFKGH